MKVIIIIFGVILLKYIISDILGITGVHKMLKYCEKEYKEQYLDLIGEINKPLFFIMCWLFPGISLYFPIACEISELEDEVYELEDEVHKNKKCNFEKTDPCITKVSFQDSYDNSAIKYKSILEKLDD